MVVKNTYSNDVNDNKLKNHQRKSYATLVMMLSSTNRGGKEGKRK